MVEMEHEGIDERIEVHEVSVPVYKRSGWRVVGDDQAAAADETRAAAKSRRREREEGVS
ncbi:hypothetical protein [Streptomyces sp. NPDC056160]|uniref:hypothetical protein n=1 Tax=Streptomyces sp. NPDC056160 TaxID=3345731 RepID=UPI0035DB8018